MLADHTEFTPDSHRLHHHNPSDVFSIDELKQLRQSYATESVLLLSPDVFDRLRSVEKQSIVVVVSPLVALTKDQVADIALWAGMLSMLMVNMVTKTCSKEYLEGKYQLVFMSPETLFTMWKWREMRREKPYYTNSKFHPRNLQTATSTIFNSSRWCHWNLS